MSDYGPPPGFTREEWLDALLWDPDDHPDAKPCVPPPCPPERSTLLGVPEGEQGVRLPPSSGGSDQP